MPPYSLGGGSTDAGEECEDSFSGLRLTMPLATKLGALHYRYIAVTWPLRDRYARHQARCDHRLALTHGCSLRHARLQPPSPAAAASVTCGCTLHYTRPQAPLHTVAGATIASPFTSVAVALMAKHGASAAEASSAVCQALVPCVPCGEDFSQQPCTEAWSKVACPFAFGLWPPRQCPERGSCL